MARTQTVCCNNSVTCEQLSSVNWAVALWLVSWRIYHQKPNNAAGWWHSLERDCKLMVKVLFLYCSSNSLVTQELQFSYHLTSTLRRPTSLVLSGTDVISLSTWHWAAHKWAANSFNCRKEEKQIQEKQRWLSTHTVHVFAVIFLTVIFQLCVQPDGPTYVYVCWGASQNKACICVSHITHTNTYTTRHAAAMFEPLWTHEVENE